jgi:biotin carboxyl carrier protein
MTASTHISPTATNASVPNRAGETLSVPERLIVAPAVGRFRLTAVAYTGAYVDEGQQIGVVEGPSTLAAVRSPFSGRLMGVLAHEGERLRAGQPVAWLRAS